MRDKYDHLFNDVWSLITVLLITLSMKTWNIAITHSMKVDHSLPEILIIHYIVHSQLIQSCVHVINSLYMASQQVQLEFFYAYVTKINFGHFLCQDLPI